MEATLLWGVGVSMVMPFDLNWVKSLAFSNNEISSFIWGVSEVVLKEEEEEVISAVGCIWWRAVTTDWNVKLQLGVAGKRIKKKQQSQGSYLDVFMIMIG